MAQTTENRNVEEFPTSMDFLDENYKKEILLKLSPALRSTWEICQVNFFHAVYSWQMTQMVEIVDFFSS